MKIYRSFQAAIRTLSFKHAVFIAALGMIAFHFIFDASYRHSGLQSVLSGFFPPLFLMCAILAILFATGIAVTVRIRDDKMAWSQGLWILAPVGLLVFWPAQETGLSPLIPLGIVAATSLTLFRILTRPPAAEIREGQTLFLSLLIAAYFLFFGFITIEKFNALQIFNPKDWAVYDQIFWNTLQGSLFSSSFYGSYLAGHSTWFFFLLVPFYALCPHPLTLAVLKTLLLSLSAVPFYKIAKDILKERPPAALILCFLFYPFLVGQNLNAPHEMGYAPFFLLWAFYFYRTGRFWPFLGSLAALLSIKEHLSALAVAFGIYAMLEKKGRRWVLAPVVLGILWGILALASLAYFKKIYHPQNDPSWFLTAFHQLYLSGRGGSFSFFDGMGGVLAAALLLILPLGVVPPLLSGISLMALPEVLLDMLARRAVLFSPLWHYNVASSCFLLVGSVEGIRKIAASGWIEKFKFQPGQARSLIAGLMLAAVLIHSYTWLDFVGYKKNGGYVAAVREAVAAVPGDAFLTVPANIAPLVSRRRNLSLVGEGEPADFVLLDGSGISGSWARQTGSRYKEIFRKEGVVVLKKDV